MGSQIALRKLAITSLAVTYARKMESNKIRHYTVSHGTMITSNRDPLEMVKEHIMREESREGSEVEFVLEASYDLITPSLSDENAFRIEEINLLSDDKELEKSLKKTKAMSTIHQTVKKLPMKVRIENFLAKKANKVINFVNSVLFKVQYYFNPEKFDGGEWFNPYFTFRMMREVYPETVINPVQFLSVAFESDEYDAAKASLLKDLRILQEKDLILGHLAMPSIIALADTIGSGKQVCAVFCFPIIDREKLASLVGIENVHTLPLQHLGLANEGFEGSLNYLNGVSPESKYEIEHVYVTDMTQEEKREKVIESYNQSLPKVSEAVVATRALLKAYPEELEKARKELDAAIDAQQTIHETAMIAARKKVAKKLTKKAPAKKKAVKKKVTKKKVAKKPTKKKTKSKK